MCVLACFYLIFFFRLFVSGISVDLCLSLCARAVLPLAVAMATTRMAVASCEVAEVRTAFILKPQSAEVAGIFSIDMRREGDTTS